jgi:hypothetical protein
MTIQQARQILQAPDLTDDQVKTALADAIVDASSWVEEAAAGTLPDVESMDLDWYITPDIAAVGVDSHAMQRLSFAIAEKIAAA